MTDAATLNPMQLAARRHRDADMLAYGTYGRMNGHFRGCSVGCFAYEFAPKHFVGGEWGACNLHAIVAEAGGYPEWLAHLQDRIGEGLPNADALNWHVDFQDAIAARKRGWDIILHAVHVPILRVSYRTAGTAQGVVQSVIDLHERAIRGEPVSTDEWSATESAAESAAASAAARAARSAARSAAWSARSAARSARSARSAAESAAASAGSAGSARSAAYQEIRDGVLAELVRE